ncbi:ATP-binding cassette domain-containing protein [Levilactobacillus fujinensis]|uniref:ATP-binding cassette domain-containing protein n=1 Tax=Levilactobacillus fujinensis TaxID=2486024 RepID=A0ABW1TIK3_9LACO|nr:ABC transporter ATP-binding protein [Levilactobacillus fujinensis]
MKFVNQKLAGLAIVMAVLLGLETPFNAATYAFIFTIIGGKHLSWLFPFVVVVIGGYLLFTLLTYWNTKVINANVVTINQRLKSALLRGLLRERMVDTKDFVATNLSFFMNDLKLLEDNYIRQLFTLISLAVAAIVTLIYSLKNSIVLTLIFLAFMTIPATVPTRFRRRITARTETWSQRNNRWSGMLKDVLNGALTIRQYRAISGVEAKTNVAIQDVEQANAKAKNTIALSDGVAEGLFYFCTFIPIGIGIYAAIAGHISLTQFVAIQYSSNMIIGSARGVINSFNTLNSTTKIRERIRLALKSASDPQQVTAAFNHLRLDQVTFSRAEKGVLNGITLNVNRGEKILIQGESGSGKTTLLRIIDGALKPASGQVRINGQEVTRFEGMSTVNQTPIVFNDSLRYNVTLGLKFADAAVLKACQRAGLGELIAQDGVGYQVGEGGQNLSGGQVKRLEIARAILFDRDLIFIDEGTASLDEKTSIAIHQTILRLDKTVIEVDHHIPATVRPLFDHTYTLANGQLTENNK